MLFTAIPTVIYLISLRGSSHALPTSTANFRDLNLGFDFEQTTRRSGPTTTIDYDLADFDEFGNDPGIYDVAGSPDAMNFADDNDQGFPNHHGFDTGQTLFDSAYIYTVTPTVSKSPANSGGISDEIREHASSQLEGGPSDEGVNLDTNYMKNNQPGNNVRYKAFDTNINNNNHSQHLEDPFNRNENRIKPSQNEASLKSKNNSVILPDSNENDKSDNANNGKQLNPLNSDKEEDNLASRMNTITRTGSKSKQSTENSSVNSSGNTEITANRQGNVAALGETSNYFRDISSGSSESEFTSISSENFDSYSVYDSNSGEVSSNSRSKENIEVGSTSSKEIVSGEDDNSSRSSLKITSSREESNNPGATDSFVSSESTDSRLFSNEEYSMHFASQSHAEAPGQLSSNENRSLSSSDENGSPQSSEIDGSQSFSDEHGSQSYSDDTISLSDENLSQSTSDENEMPLSSDKPSSFISTENELAPPSEETTENASTDPDNDFDNDNDNDINNSPQMSSEKEKSANSVADQTVGKDAPEPNNNLAGCFSSKENDGKFCPLLRALYSICSVQFKQECVSGSSEHRQSFSKDNPNSNVKMASLDTSASSDSIEDLYPNSFDSIASDEVSRPTSKPSSMSFETVENLSASFEKSTGILDIIDIIREACSSVCALADSHTGRQSSGTKPGSVRDEYSSESSEEDEFGELTKEAFTDSDEDENGENSNFTYVTSVEVPASVPAASSEEKGMSSLGSREYSVEKNTREQSIEDSFASSGGTDSINSADSSGELSFEYTSYVSENTSE